MRLYLSNAEQQHYPSKITAAEMGQTLNGHSLKQEPGRAGNLVLGKEQFLAIPLPLLPVSRMVWISFSQELG